MPESRSDCAKPGCQDAEEQKQCEVAGQTALPKDIEVSNQQWELLVRGNVHAWQHAFSGSMRRL